VSPSGAARYATVASQSIVSQFPPTRHYVSTERVIKDEYGGYASVKTCLFGPQCDGNDSTTDASTGYAEALASARLPNSNCVQYTGD